MAGETFRPTNLDLALATAVALGLPPAAAWLLDRRGGALLGLLLYYGVCGVGLVRWRRGALGYGRPARWPWALFLASLLLPLASAAINLQGLPDSGAAPAGIAVTALVWAPLNAALEQVAWLYVLDSWRRRWALGAARWVGLGVGTLLFLALVGGIHALFWARFLPLPSPTAFAALAIPLNLLLAAAYVLLWDRAGSLWPVWILHLLVDLQLVLIARYSIVPFL